ncbi:MAG: hypothetical protein NVS1B14_06570 [Vulcanimicrobiaceae bacterium]
MKRLLSVLAAVGALSLAMSPAVAPAATHQTVLGIITGKQVGTVTRRSGNRVFSMHFSPAGKLLSATESGGAAHGMSSTPLTITKSHTAPMGKHSYSIVYNWCYYYVCDAYGYCYIYYYYC